MTFREIVGRGYELFIGLAVAGLTCYPRSVPGWLGLALICGLLENRYVSKEQLNSYSKATFIALLIPAFFFLLNLSGLIHTENINLGQKDVGRKITLIIVPIFLMIKGIDRRRVSLWMTFYLIGVVIALLWNNVNSYIQYAETGDTGFFFGEYGITQMHIGYFALHLLVAIGIVVQRIFSYHLTNRNFAYGLGLVALYIILNMILTGSKMGFLTLIAMLGVSFILMLIRGIAWKKIVVATLTVVAILALLVSQTSFLAERFQRLTISTPIRPDSVESTQARRMTWICASDVFSNAPLLGYGTGDTQATMQECYSDKGYRGPESKALGPHSQYLESGIAVGILGSLSVLMMFLLPLLRALKLEHIVSTMFFLSFLMACISESILERAMGIHLFSVLLAIVLMWMEHRKEDLRAGLMSM